MSFRPDWAAHAPYHVFEILGCVGKINHQVQIFAGTDGIDSHLKLVDMYYRDIDPNLCLTGQLLVGDVEVTVDMGNPNGRFGYLADSSICTVNSIDELSVALGLSDQDKTDAKSRVLAVVKTIASRIESRYPDSTTGLAGFIEGGPYRTPLHDGFYDYTPEVSVSSGVYKYLEHNSTMCFDYHLARKLQAPWPLTMQIKKRSRNDVSISKLLFDPYQFCDLFGHLCTDSDVALEWTKENGCKESVEFMPVERYNRLTIKDAIGDIHMNLEDFKNKLVDVFIGFLVDLSEYRKYSRHAEDAIAFILVNVQSKRALFPRCENDLKRTDFDYRVMMTPGLGFAIEDAFVNAAFGAGFFVNEHQDLGIDEYPDQVMSMLYAVYEGDIDGSLDRFIAKVQEDFEIYIERITGMSGE